MKKLILLITILCASIAGYSQMNTFGGIGLRVNDSTAYVTNAAAYHTAGYSDIWYSNSSDLWWVWDGAAYVNWDPSASGGGGGTPGGSDTQVQFNSGSFGGDPDFTFTGGNTLNVDFAIVDAETYGSGWNGDNSVPTKNDTYDQVELKQALVNSATTITDASTMDITAIKNTLTTSSATRTFTISYTGDDITLIVTLNALASTFTFPAGSLCVSEGIASSDNTCALAGTSGDKYVIAIKNVGGVYYVVCKNFAQ